MQSELWLSKVSAECVKERVKFLSQIHSTDTTSVIVIPACKLNHSGRYIINAESPAGHRVVKVRVSVLGKAFHTDTPGRVLQSV